MAKKSKSKVGKAVARFINSRKKRPSSPISARPQLVVVQQRAPMASRARSIVRRVGGGIRRAGSATRSAARRIGGYQRKPGFDVKSIMVSKVKQLGGAAIDVGIEVASTATQNTYDDMINSAPVKIAIATGLELLFGRSAHDIGAGMTGSAAGKWMRDKVKAV